VCAILGMQMCRCPWHSVDMLCQIMSHLHVVRGKGICNTICRATQGAAKELQHDCALFVLHAVVLTLMQMQANGSTQRQGAHAAPGISIVMSCLAPRVGGRAADVTALMETWRMRNVWCKAGVAAAFVCVHKRRKCHSRLAALQRVGSLFDHFSAAVDGGQGVGARHHL
jgi:hypothetical protein